MKEIVRKSRRGQKSGKKIKKKYIIYRDMLKKKGKLKVYFDTEPFTLIKKCPVQRKIQNIKNKCVK